MTLDTSRSVAPGLFATTELPGRRTLLILQGGLLARFPLVNLGSLRRSALVASAAY